MKDNKITIGSQSMSDIVIAEQGVAELHAFVYLDDDKVCLDLQPGCSAWLNGNEVQGRYWLQDSDVVAIGSQRLDLIRIGLALEAQAYDLASDGPLTTDFDSAADTSDAVVIRHNPWPTIIFVAILVAILSFLGTKIKRNFDRREAQKAEVMRQQDSINEALRTIDSLNDRLNQFENE